MSGKVMGMVFEADLPRVEKFVLLAIADHADDEGRGCYASEARIVYKTGYDLSYVQRTIRQLRSQGILVYSHAHPEIAVDVWDIDLEQLTRQTPYKAWLRTEWPNIVEKRHGTGEHAHCPDTSRPGDVPRDAGQPGHNSPNASEPGSISPVHGNGSPDGGNNSPINLPYEPPSVNRPNNHPAATAAPTGLQTLPPIQDAPRPASTDGGQNRVPLDEPPDERVRERPDSDLQRQVVKLCHARYLSGSMKVRLGNPVTAVWNHGPPQTYQSPEEEWQSNPGLFAEYVELCARRIREESGRPPSRSDLIQTIRRYERRNTGWLDFKASQARASPRARPWYVTDPDTPSWMW